MKDKIRPEEINLYNSSNHIGNFLDCVKSRRLTIRPPKWPIVPPASATCTSSPSAWAGGSGGNPLPRLMAITHKWPTLHESATSAGVMAHDFQRSRGNCDVIA